MTVNNVTDTEFFKAVENRRTFYDITDKSTISDAEIQAIVEKAVTHTPSSFNTQSTRAVVVLHEKNKQLWDALWAAHEANAPAGFTPEANAGLKFKFDNIFRAGYGTVVFAEDDEVVDTAVKRNPAFAHLFPVFSTNTAGIAQFITWTALEAAGMGANLQHYAQLSPAHQKAVTSFLGVPNTWKVTALMTFGVSKSGDAGPKTFLPIEDRVKVVA